MSVLDEATVTDRQAPTRLACSCCAGSVQWYPAPLARWVCAGCAVSWPDLTSPGLPEGDQLTLTDPLGVRGAGA